MKKTLTLLFCLLSLKALIAQCTPDVNAVPNGSFTAAYPSDLTQTCVNNAYTDTITIAYPIDTIVFGFPIATDSCQIISVNNLPAGLNWVCGAPQCKTIGNAPNLTHDCILIDGIPTDTTGVNNQLVIAMTLWVTVPFLGPMALADTLYVGLYVDVCTGLQNQQLSLLNVYPNPAHDQVQIELGPTTTGGTVKIYNTLGTLVLNEAIAGSSASFDVRDFTSGVYFFVIETASGITSKRLVIE